MKAKKTEKRLESRIERFNAMQRDPSITSQVKRMMHKPGSNNAHKGSCIPKDKRPIAQRSRDAIAGR